MVETKTLTLKVEEVAPPPVGEPEFTFVSYSLTEPREVFPATTSYPTLTKTYKEGDTVKIVYRVKNIGNAPGRWTIEVKNLDTGAVITTWYGDLDPGYSFKSALTGATVGRMPSKDWRLSFRVTP
ncbi:hypothetical protein HQ586_00695 [Candidatus Bathyarchaeota archaeon]|nr:hypothetical protein [Candidatus Bathyarchaeota archaeon]